MLCQNWIDYSDTPLDVFVAPVYEMLIRRKSELPKAFITKVDSMVSEDFLLSYRSKPKMKSSLKWMDNRVNFPSDFVGAINDVEENYTYIEELFGQFFPDLVSYVNNYCKC